MRTNANVYDPFTQELFLKDGVSPRALHATVDALRMNIRVKDVMGDAIPGALSGADKIFTRSDTFFFVDRQVVKFTDLVETATEDNFRVGEEIQESGSGAKGEVLEVTSKEVVIKNIYDALFTGLGTLTGQDSTITATADGVETRVLNLVNDVAWMHLAGNPAGGALARIIANDATTFTTQVAMYTGATAAMIFANADEAVTATRIEEDYPRPLMDGELISVTGSLDGTEGKAAVLPIDCSGAAVALTLPDVRAVPVDQQYCFVGVDVETNAFTLLSPLAGQTLDGVDISSGGVPYADIDADGDFLIIQREGNGWVTMKDGIQ